MKRYESRRELRRQRDSARAWAVDLENQVAQLNDEANNLAEHILRRSVAHSRYVARVAGRIGRTIAGSLS